MISSVITGLIKDLNFAACGYKTSLIKTFRTFLPAWSADRLDQKGMKKILKKSLLVNVFEVSSLAWPGILILSACGRSFLNTIYSYFSLDRKVSKRSRLTPILEKSTISDFTPRGNRFEIGLLLSSRTGTIQNRFHFMASGDSPRLAHVFPTILKPRFLRQNCCRPL